MVGWTVINVLSGGVTYAALMEYSVRASIPCYLSQPYPDSVLSLHFSHVLTDRLGNRTQVPQPGLYIGEHYPLSCLSCSYLVVLTGFRPPKRLLWSRELPLTHRASVESLTTKSKIVIRGLMYQVSSLVSTEYFQNHCCHFHFRC